MLSRSTVLQTPFIVGDASPELSENIEFCRRNENGPVLSAMVDSAMGHFLLIDRRFWILYDIVTKAVLTNF